MPDNESRLTQTMESLRETTIAGSHSPGGSVQESPEAYAAGEMIMERFEVMRFLGRGSFGSVFLAHDHELQRLVAVKKPRGQLISLYESVEHFIAEARAVAQLDHENIVPVYDVLRAEDGDCFIVSKFIPGQDLGWKKRKRELSLSQIVRLVREVADALHHAHLNDIVHRDIKPANIILGDDGRAYVTDFGIASHSAATPEKDGIAATPAYMSPEQADPTITAYDGRSDIYSLGVVLYELLCLRLPFEAASGSELLAKIQSGSPRPPRQIDDSIPRILEEICLRAMSSNPAQRYTTALDLARDLEEYVGYTPAPMDFDAIQVPPELLDLVEKLAEHTHDIWAEQRFSEGWKLGDVRDDARKTHPCLVPYDQLPESEKEYDRATVMANIKAMLSLGYRIVNPSDKT